MTTACEGVMRDTAALLPDYRKISMRLLYCKWRENGASNPNAKRKNGSLLLQQDLTLHHARKGTVQYKVIWFFNFFK